MKFPTCLGVLAGCVLVLLSASCADGLRCGNKDCDSHHDTCQFQHATHWHCTDSKHCRGLCRHDMPEPERHECCCHDQDCINGMAHLLVNPYANLTAPGMTCGSDICNSAAEPFCVMRHEGFVCDHRCDQHSCEHVQPDHDGHIPDCCCRDQACVDSVTSKYNVPMAGIKCPDCPNVQHNDCHGDLHHRCKANELCKVMTNDNGILSTNCQRNDDCLREQLASVFGPDAKSQYCCAEQSCLVNAQRQALGITTTGATVAPTSVQTNAPMASTITPQTTTMPLPPTTSTPLDCPICTDAFTGNCSQNGVCASNEACLLLVSAGKLQTGCKEIHDCQYHERIGDSICCTDKNCTDVAFKKMNDLAFTCPTCQNTQDPQSCMSSPGKCSYLSKGCMITQTQGGISSGCNTHKTHCQRAEDANSVLCNVHPIPFSFNPGLQCSFCCHKNDSTCVLDALGIHDVTPPPTSGSAAGPSAACVDHDDASFSCQTYDTQYGLCSSSSPMMVHLVDTKCRKTCGKCPGAVTGAPTVGSSIQCADKLGTCAGMASFLCSSIDPTSQLYAKENCAKTCNLCVTIQTTTVIPCVDIDGTCAGMASFLCSSSDPASQAWAKSHCAKTCNLCTSPTTTTAPVQCVDHDVNNNCGTMAHALCTSQDRHVKNFAIATCAKTCNLCTEYQQHLAGLTIPLLG